MSEQWIKVARQAADKAAQVIAQHTPDKTQVEHKSDNSPVTIADREAEKALREVLCAAFPEHAIWGEEYGRDEQQSTESEYLWLLDPIDGTKSWISGLPFWSIQIALEKKGDLRVGVSHAPAINEQAWAVKGEGAWLNNQPLQTSSVTSFSDCRLSSGNIGSLAAKPSAWSAFGKLLTQCNRIRGYGDYYHYHRLAAGQLDAVVESDVNILDIAALSLIVEEAGGVFTDLNGAPINLDTTSVLATATPELHANILSLLNS